MQPNFHKAKTLEAELVSLEEETGGRIISLLEVVGEPYHPSVDSKEIVVNLELN